MVNTVPALSVVVLTHNRLASLQRTVEAILQHMQADYELIVVDNGSSDGTADWLRTLEYPIRSILNPTNEFVCARNYGILQASAPFIAQVDDDVIVHPGWDAMLLEPMLADPNIGATGQHGFYQDVTWATLIDDRRRPAPGQFCDLVMGFCWAWRNDQNWSVRSEITGPRFLYDWDFNPFWHEESDLQMQIREAGYRILCVPEIATHNSLHDWRATHANEGIASKDQAESNFYRLREKWRDKMVRFEGPAVGL